MFQIDFGNNTKAICHKPGAPFISEISRSDIDYVLLTRWEEHCLECSAPDCFNSCSMYKPRADFMCQRYEYGIAMNNNYSGLLNFGADIKFKRWGKLQSKLGYNQVGCTLLSWICKLDCILVKLIRPLTTFTNKFYQYNKANPSLIYNYIRYRLIQFYFRANGLEQHDFDEFLIEAINPAKEDFILNIEISTAGEAIYRTAVPIKSGRNLHRLPLSEMNLDLKRASLPDSTITIFPSNDHEAHIIFTWLNFVKYKGTPPPVKSLDQTNNDGLKKIKCVVWDLDNTLWNGILIEDGKDNVRLRKNCVTLIKQLDERGIIQTVSSKNDYDEAWELIKYFDLDQYFVYPTINWSPKSENIKIIAENLNIHLDTFAFIDDSPFERAEVSNTLPVVRTYSDTEVDTLLERSEFNSLTTNESRKRRSRYQDEISRKEVAAQSVGSHDDFLKTCQMQVNLFTPTDMDQIKRCFELIQRTNQLNISGYRYSQEEFNSVINSKDVISLGISCSDRFGDYGIVGYVSIKITADQPPLINEFVLSCRVARKKVEHALFNWIKASFSKKGANHIQLKFISTSRNELIKTTLIDVGFREQTVVNDAILMSLSCKNVIAGSGIVIVSNNGLPTP